MDRELLDYFKCMLVAKKTAKILNYQFMTKGILLDFTPTSAQELAIKQYIRDSNVSTLLSIEEVNNLSTDEKIIKQLAHYVLQFGTNYAFDVMRNTDEGSNSVTITLIRGVTKAALQKLVDDTLYSNRPAKDVKILTAIIRHYGCKYQINGVKNNELRVALFDVGKDVFTNGDDAVRYIVNTCTESDLLIKSPQVVEAVRRMPKVSAKYLDKHRLVLAQVFNRHKRILMAVKVGSKDAAIKAAINRISHLSKSAHVPLAMPPSKSFVSDVFKRPKTYKFGNLKTFTLRDKLKLLNLLEFKLVGSSTDIFTIRNGKMHVARDRPVYDKAQLREVIAKVLKSIKKDLAHLKDKTILLPEDIDYGLPVSRKQSVGNLPFGTKVTVLSGDLSSGVYWKNEWGARDIDLSAVDENGSRTGWGSRHGFDRGGETGVQFSGDIVNAPNGAMEFLTSSSENYGLFANIFNGNIGTKIQVIVGQRSKKTWIEQTVIREELALKSRGNLVGLVQGRTFIVFYGRMNESRISSERNKIMIQKALTMRWTLKALFGYLGIKYENTFGAEWLIATKSKKVDYDLSYAGFTYDKLEAMLGI